jgi:hypothetical protein
VLVTWTVTVSDQSLLAAMVKVKRPLSRCGFVPRSTWLIILLEMRIHPRQSPRKENQENGVLTITVI